MTELSRHSQDVAWRFRLERLQHAASKAQIVQLKVNRATSREMVSDLDPRFNVMNFWNNILNVHCIRAFNGNLH